MFLKSYELRTYRGVPRNTGALLYLKRTDVKLVINISCINHKLSYDRSTQINL